LGPVKKQTVETRRAEILEATCAVVIERGFAGTRISDVATQLDVSTSLIHYHFDSKEHLLAEAFAHFARKDLEQLAAQLALAPTAIAQLDRWLHDCIPEGSEHLEWMLWIDAWGEALRNPLMRRISQELDIESTRLLEQLVRFGADRGEFRCADPEGAAERLSGLVDGLAVQFAAHDGVLARERLLHHLRVAASAELGVPLDVLEGSTPAPASPGVLQITEPDLHRLITRWCDAVTHDDVDMWLSTWHREGRWELPDHVVEGIEALRARWSAERSGWSWMVETAPLVTLDVDADGKRAAARVVMARRGATGDGTVHDLLASSTDELELTDGGWRFVSRRWVPLPGASALLTG
jgi:AcrR family transcriptional regulator